MNAMAPAIQILEHRAGELREQLRGLEAAIAVLRGSTALTPAGDEEERVRFLALDRETENEHAPAPAIDAEQLLAAIDDLGPRANEASIAWHGGVKPEVVRLGLAELERAGRIRVVPLGPLKGLVERIADEPAEEPAAAEEPAPVEQAKAEPEMAAPAPAAPSYTVKLKVPAAPKVSPRRRVVDPAPASRSASSRPAVARPAAAVQALVSKDRKAVAADEAAAIKRHLAAKGAAKYEAGTMLALLERTFVGAGKTFEYQAGHKAARAPYLVNGRSLSPAKAIEAANEIRRKAGLELIAVPGKPARRGWR